MSLPTTLPDELRCPGAWPVPSSMPVELIETHVSWIFRGEHDVFKVKKPVSLGFLDFGSAQRRRAACEDEVRLNARLAPGVYRGVVPIVRQPDGRLAFGGAANRACEGEVVDWAVHMVRLPDSARADALLAVAALKPAHLDAIASIIADLHARTAVDRETAVRFASPSAIERNVRENFDQIRQKARDIVDDQVASEVEHKQLDFVRGRAALLEERLATRICDGHGDLRLEHVYLLPQGLRIIDCIEFDERYRIADACADVAFLAMDLAGRGDSDLAERFLAAYARASQDYDLYAFVDFYESYRAWIRGKVSAVLAEDAGADGRTRAEAAKAARSHFLLAQACERPPLLAPTLVCVGGIVASGKSTVAECVAGELGCPIVDTDRARRHLLGASQDHPRDEPAWQGAYDPAVTDRVYTEVLRRASVVLSSGRSVVVDASFRASSARGRARDLARSRGAEFRFVHCQAPPDVCRARLQRREAGPSEAHLAMFDAFVASFEPVGELPAAELVEIDTTNPPARSAEMLRERIATWPRGLR
ncbi:MAG TPA: AAA family ATPase [Polyangiaceae bacterium]|nr:AAA family ATPase [Polyangiaceae bacterium]